MYKLFYLLVFMGVANILHAQGPDSLILKLKSINKAVEGRALLSNRGLNIFLSEAAGYYLSDPEDLTLYKNSVLASSADGTLAIYHNLRQATGMDEPVRSFLSIGVQANVADAFVASSEQRPYDNQFGFLVKQTWVGRSKVTATPDQLRTMDTMRAAILHSCETAILRRYDDFLFDVDLPQEFEFEYAHQQAETLAKTFTYHVIAFHWTSISFYIPLITENIQVAPSAGEDPATRHAYPLHFNISHTRLWQGSTFGRVFLSVAGNLALNNSRDGYLLAKSGNLYTGNYRTFVTPDIKGRIIWLPRDSHFGVSFSAQQAMGDYHALNGVLGFPIVLINKKAEPAVNFEFQLRFYDMGHSIDAGNGLAGRTAVGVTVGVPMSKIAY